MSPNFEDKKKFLLKTESPRGLISPLAWVTLSKWLDVDDGFERAWDNNSSMLLY